MSSGSIRQPPSAAAVACQSSSKPSSGAGADEPRGATSRDRHAHLPARADVARDRPRVDLDQVADHAEAGRARRLDVAAPVGRPSGSCCRPRTAGASPGTAPGAPPRARGCAARRSTRARAWRGSGRGRAWSCRCPGRRRGRPPPSAHPRRGRSRGHHAGTARRYSSYCAPYRSGQRRLLVQPHERRHQRPHHRGVEQQVGAAQQQRLADDRRRDGDVHHVAHVAVRPADHQLLGRRRRRRRAEPLDHEARERLDEHRAARDHQDRAEHAQRRPPVAAGLPAGEQLRHHARHHARRDREEQRAARRRPPSGASFADVLVPDLRVRGR